MKRVLLAMVLVTAMALSAAATANPDDRYITRYIEAQLVHDMFPALANLPDKNPGVAAGYTDLKGTHWAFKAIDLVSTKGLMLGYPDGTFKGSRTTTRYEMSYLLLMIVEGMETASGKQLPATDTPLDYTDVTAKHWAYKAIDILVKKRILPGMGTFRGSKNITKGEAKEFLATIQAKFAQSLPLTPSVTP